VPGRDYERPVENFAVLLLVKQTLDQPKIYGINFAAP
jgi:hypothetical protein